MPETLPFEYRTRQRDIPWEDPKLARRISEQRDRELEDFLANMPTTGGAQKYAHMTRRWTQNYISSAYAWTDVLITSGADGVAIPTENTSIEVGGIEINEAGLYLVTYNWIVTTRVASTTWSRFDMSFTVDPTGPTTDPSKTTFDGAVIAAAADTDDIQGGTSNTLVLGVGDIVLPPSTGFVGTWRHQSLDVHASVVWISPTVPYLPCS